MDSLHCATIIVLMNVKLVEKYVPEVKINTDLSQIVLEILEFALNSLQKGRERLIEISVDGRIEDNEIKDFIAIQKELDNISVTVNALKIWAGKEALGGKINRELYDKLYESRGIIARVSLE